MSFPIPLPDPGDPPVSASHLRLLMERPRPSLEKLRSQLDVLVNAGAAEAIQTNRYTYYRWKPQTEGINPVVTPIAAPVPGTYNGPQNHHETLIETDWFQKALEPIRAGQHVTLWMNYPTKTKVQRSLEQGRKLIVIYPFQTHKQIPKTLLISVVGSGSCIVNIDKITEQFVIDFNSSKDVANLVLAGVPARLAKVLMNAIHQAMK